MAKNYGNEVWLIMDQNRDWMKDTKGRPYYTVLKTDDTPPHKPDNWEDLPYREKRDIAVRMLGTAKGRNLISTAIQFFLTYGKLDKWDRDIAEMFRGSLFNCNPVTDVKVRKVDGQ